ncbi:zinc finger and BTB domain-containing protein 9 [Athene noctua]|uniref:zinc finger and BTB domain-containing protein 9 n=1 Tax=Athene noctua TaxID=126797 RepID=UPI003EBB9A35
MAAEGGRVQISFPQHAAALLDSLNRLRLEGKFCDVAVHVGGRIFPAHKSVLAAASPFFHDKLLLQDGGRLLLPPAIDPDAFEGLLHLIYSGRLTLLLEALPGHLLVASGLQMWHVVDQCSEILRELEGGACRWAGRGGEVTSSSSSGREAASSWPNRGGGGDSSSSSWPNRGGDGSACPNRGGDGSNRGGDGSSSSSWPNRGGDGSSSSSWPNRGGDGSSSSSWPNRGGDGSSWPNRGGDGASSSSWPNRGGDTAPPPLSFAKDGGEEVLKIRVATDMAPAAPGSLLQDAGEEVLKICVEEDEEEEDDEEEDGAHRRHHRPADALQIVLEEEEEEDGAPGDTRDPPKIFYIKQEAGGDAAAAAAEGLLAPSELAEVSYVIPAGGGAMMTTGGAAVMSTGGGGAAAAIFPQPSWKPVDLHGNEILGRGQALHAPVKLGAAPDGKRFGCLCGKRFAVKPKRDRHIMLTFSLRPFACAACHKRFKLKHHLTEHMKTHDGAARACERCGRRFRLRSGLAKHRPLCQGARWGGGCWACE